MNSFSLIAFVCLISVFCLQTEEYLLQELNVGSSALLVLTMTANQQTYAAVWHQGTCNLDASHIFDFEKSTILYHAPTSFLFLFFFLIQPKSSWDSSVWFPTSGIPKDSSCFLHGSKCCQSRQMVLSAPGNEHESSWGVRWLNGSRSKKLKLCKESKPFKMH